MQLFRYHPCHRAYGRNENIAGFGTYRVFVAVRIHIFGLAPGFDGQARHIHRGERQVSASYGRFYSVDIFKHSCAAAHGGHFVKVAFGVVGLPEVVLVVFGVQKQEIRE